MTFLDATAPWAENAAVIAEKRLSRYPLRQGPHGQILGFIHVKTILVDLLAGRVPDVTREVIKLPRASEELLLEVAVRKLQKSGEHMGLVTNTKGEDVGMFTLEDIVEELIGDIRDEFESPPDDLPPRPRAARAHPARPRGHGPRGPRHEDGARPRARGLRASIRARRPTPSAAARRRCPRRSARAWRSPTRAWRA